MNEQISTIQTREVLELMRNLAPILNQKELFEFMSFSNRVLERYMPEHYNDGLSEEVTEMKNDKEWLKKEIEEYLEYEGVRDARIALESVLGYIDQLDEPEKPVIPKFVADFIRATKPNNSLRLAFEYIAQRKIDNYDDELAFWIEEGNSELFANAWLDGYEVEKEKKYYVLNNCRRTILVKFFGKQIAPSQGMKLEDIGNNNSDYQFTEQEIKNYDKRYWQFAEEVTE